MPLLVPVTPILLSKPLLLLLLLLVRKPMLQVLALKLLLKANLTPKMQKMQLLPHKVPQNLLKLLLMPLLKLLPPHNKAQKPHKV